MAKNPTILASLATLALLAGCATTEMGSQSAKTTATGSAGGQNSQGANSQLERCDRTVGTVTIVEDVHSAWYAAVTGQYQLGSTQPVLRLLLQQSNCFVVVERGRAMNNMMQERALASGGELRQNSKMHKGQMVAADYTLSPSITFSENTGGGGLGAIGGKVFGSLGGAIAGSVRVHDASTLLTLIDNRSGVQLAAAEGSSRSVDFGLMGGLFGGSGAGGLGGYGRTPQGKAIVAAFTDSLNNLIRAVRNYKAQDVKGGLGTGGTLKVN